MQKEHASNPFVDDQAVQSDDEEVSGDEAVAENFSPEDASFIAHDGEERERKLHCHRLVPLRRLKRGRDRIEVDDDELEHMRENMGLVSTAAMDTDDSDSTDLEQAKTKRPRSCSFIVEDDHARMSLFSRPPDAVSATEPKSKPFAEPKSATTAAASSQRTKTFRWTPEEDALLIKVAGQHRGRKRWSAVASHFPGKAPKQCSSRHALLCPKKTSKPMRDLNALGEAYARQVLRRVARSGGVGGSALVQIHRARAALQHEIAGGKCGLGCGRCSSYFAMMVAALGVRQNGGLYKRLTRADMVEVVEVAEEVVLMELELERGE